MTLIEKKCPLHMDRSEDACLFCAGEWEYLKLLYPPLPLEDVRSQLADWPATLSLPAILTIEASNDGLRVRMLSSHDASSGPASVWASSTKQNSRWSTVDQPSMKLKAGFALSSPADFPVLAAGAGDPILTVGAGLLALAAEQRTPVTLFVMLLGVEERLQERLRSLFAYSTGTEKGVDDDSPNPWDLRLKLWRAVMGAGASFAAVGGAAYAPGWIPAGAAGVLVLAGCALACAGFMGTQRWMKLRSLPAEVVSGRTTGTLMRVSILIAAQQPEKLRLLSGDQKWKKISGIWPGAQRYSFPLSAADVTALIAPPETGDGAGVIADDSIQATPVPFPSDALLRAPFFIGSTPTTGEAIGIDHTGHTLIVGGSRTGKSSAVFSLMREMLQNPEGGPGLFLVDPHNSLADAFLHSIDLLPVRQREQVIQRLRIITPNANAVMPLNPLMIEDFTWAGNALVLAGQRIWNEFWGPRMQATLLALARLVHAWNFNRTEGYMGLIHTVYAAYNRDWREQTRSFLQPAHQAGVDALNALLGESNFPDGRQNTRWITEVMSPILSKLMALELSPWLYAALHQNGFIDLEGWIKNKAWIVLRLPTGEMGREAARLTAGVVYNIFEAAFRKVTTHSAVPYNFIIDEVQEIGGAMALESLLSEGGKFGARIFVLAQSLSLLRQSEGFKPVVQALLANTSAQLFFSPDPDDEVIVRKTLSLQARFGETTIDIPSLHAWLRARLNGQWQPPTLIQVPPILAAEHKRVERVISDVIRTHQDSYTDWRVSEKNSLDFMQKQMSPKKAVSKTNYSDSKNLGW